MFKVCLSWPRNLQFKILQSARGIYKNSEPRRETLHFCLPSRALNKLWTNLHLQRQQQRAVLDSDTPTAHTPYTEHRSAHTHTQRMRFSCRRWTKKRRIEFQKKDTAETNLSTQRPFPVSVCPCCRCCCCPCPFAHRFGLIQLDLQRLLGQIVLNFVWHRWTPVTAGPSTLF